MNKKTLYSNLCVVISPEDILALKEHLEEVLCDSDNNTDIMSQVKLYLKGRLTAKDLNLAFELFTASEGMVEYGLYPTSRVSSENDTVKEGCEDLIENVILLLKNVETKHYHKLLLI